MPRKGFDGQEVLDEFRRVFDTEPDLDMLWFLVKMCKHVRLRARNNSAFNNYMNRCFPGFNFQQVEKKRQDGTSYPGLEIRPR